MPCDADVIVVGAGLSGLVAAAELASAGKSVIIVEQEPEQSLGGQAFWSLGGLFLVNSPEQKRLGIHDSHALALQDWLNTAGFDREEDFWPRRWAEAYVDFAAGEKRSWLRTRGVRFFPVVGWAERGGYHASGRGNSVPRFHITRGTGPGVIAPFVRSVLSAAKDGRLVLKFRHRVNELIGGATIEGIRGDVLAPSPVERGRKSSRDVVGRFELRAQATIIASGGIGADEKLVRRNWPESLGTPPKRMIVGVPDHVDGRMLAIAQAAGGAIINPDRMWHYVEGIKNFSPIWTSHGIRILSGPSPLWLDACGKRLPIPLFPGFDTLGALKYITATGYDHSWFILNKKIIKKEFALSGSEQNPDLTEAKWWSVLLRAAKGIPRPVQNFMEKGEDFIVEGDLVKLVSRMNALVGGAPLLNVETVEREIVARDSQLDNPYCKDMQITAIRATRRYIGDRLLRTARPHRLLDPAAGPLIAVRLHILTRKTLGGLHTDLDSRVLALNGRPVPGLYAAGEAAGFGGGGVHGYAALEGTFLGGCIFSGRAAGRAAAAAVL